MVLAGIMVAVLGVCTLMAVGLSVGADTGATRLTVGPFQARAPYGFQKQGPSSESVVQLVERYGAQRVLQVALLADGGLRSPLSARAEAARELAPASQWSDGPVLSDGPLVAFCWVGLSQGETPSGQPALRKHLLAVATEDGRSYVAAMLSGFGRPDQSDYDVIARLVDQLDDTRWAEAESDRVTLDGLELRAPGRSGRWLVASDDGAADRVVLYQSGAPEFFRLHAAMDQLDSATAEGVEGPLARAERYVKLAFAAQRGGPPADNRVNRGKVNGVPTAFVAQAIDPEGKPTLETWAAALPEADRVLRLDVLSSGSHMQARRRLAQALIAQLPRPTNDAPAAPASATEGEADASPTTDAPSTMEVPDAPAE